MKTIGEVLQGGIDYLEKRGVEGARSSMQALMAHVLEVNRTWIYLHMADPMTEEQLAPLRELLRSRGQGTPLQHLLGEVEFYRRSFRSDARALIPRPETEELVELAIREMKGAGEGLRVLDMGCGSGVIGITLALELHALKPEVVMADISPVALDLALENATSLGAKVKLFRSDLFSAWQPAEQAEDTRIIPPAPFDLIVANLPYVPTNEKLSAEVQHDPATALVAGDDGLAVIRRFVPQALEYLVPEGRLLLEVGHDQGERVQRLMEESGYEDVALLKDLNDIARFPMGRRPAAVEENLSSSPVDEDAGNK